MVFVLPPRKIRITFLDLLVGLILTLTCGWFVHRMMIRMEYDWNWPTIGQYLLRFDPVSGHWTPNLLLQGMFTTIRLSLWSMLLATVIGLVMGVLGSSRKMFRKIISTAYVETCRNLPPLVMVFIFYFFIGDQILPLVGIEKAASHIPAQLERLLSLVAADPDQIAPFLSAVITLAIIEGAYIAEIIRSGIAAIATGQWEAAQSIGMDRWRTLQLVILPQAVRQILPPLAGQFISTIKDSAIVAVISIQELTFQGMELMSSTYMTFEIWITITAMYFVLTMTCSAAVRRLETRLNSHLQS